MFDVISKNLRNCNFTVSLAKFAQMPPDDYYDGTASRSKNISLPIIIIIMHTVYIDVDGYIQQWQSVIESSLWAHFIFALEHACSSKQYGASRDLCVSWASSLNQARVLDQLNLIMQQRKLLAAITRGRRTID